MTTDDRKEVPTERWEKQWKELRSTTLGYTDAEGNFVVEMDKLEKRDIDFIRDLLSRTRQETENEIREIISKYQNAEEIVKNGQRFLVSGDEEIPFGYPFPDTKEKYIVRDILTALKHRAGEMK